MKSTYMLSYLCNMRLTIILVVITLLTSCNNYGTSLHFGNGELYFTKDVTEGEATRLGNYLIKQGFFDQAKSMQLTRNGSGFELHVIQNSEPTPEASQALKELGIVLSEHVFEGQPVQVVACDENFLVIP